MRLTDTFAIGDSLIEIAFADITTADVEVIVNSICDRLHIGFGVSGAILSRGGPSALISAERAQTIDLEPGTVHSTSAGNLPYQHVFHAISSRCGSGTSKEILERCTHNSLRLARKLEVKTIAFPALGTGEMDFDIREAAVTMINAVVRDCKANRGIDRIVFCLLRPDAFTTFFREAVKASVKDESGNALSSDCDNPTTEEQTTDRGRKLVAQLATIPAGRERWHDYEDIATDIFEHLFVPPLSSPRRQARTESGLSIRDAVFPNAAENGFWSLLDRRYTARLVPLECKNYVDPIGQDPVNQLSRYLRGKALGNVGILASRLDPSQQAIDARREVFRDLDQVLLFLSDFDLSQLVEVKRLAGNAEQYLQQKIDDFALEY